MEQILYLPQTPGARDVLIQQLPRILKDFIHNAAQDVFSSTRKFLKQDWVKIRSQAGGTLYYCPQINRLFPDLIAKNIQTLDLRSDSLPEYPSFDINGMPLAGSYLTKDEFIQVFSNNLTELSSKFEWDLNFCQVFAVTYGNEKALMPRNNNRHKTYRLNSPSIDKSKVTVIPSRLLTEGSNLDAYSFLAQLHQLRCAPVLNPQYENMLQLYFAYEDLQTGPNRDSLPELLCILNKYVLPNQSAIRSQMPDESWLQWQRMFLECDKARANLPLHPAACLNESGHWDLFQERIWNNNAVSFLCQQELFNVRNRLIFARSPRDDAKTRPCYVAIDFGTKSTVVASCGHNQIISPHIIGDPMPGTGLDPSKQFENPTVLRFTGLKSFLEDYGKNGRPNTKWNDASTSHDAWNDLKNSTVEDIRQYIYKLKQWANSHNGPLIIIDAQDNCFQLNDYTKDNPLDPIELYAYYIGLYINRMSDSNVFMDYLLAFPTSYPSHICDRILESFRRGLKKSIPTPLQEDTQFMDENFHVEMPVSEPAAYAICSVEIQAKSEQGPFLYGVYDFGGGTTDFSIGVYCPHRTVRKNPPSTRIPQQESCLIELENGGISDLGGENLLEQAAWNVFTQNAAKLPDGVHFTSPFANTPMQYSNYVSNDKLAQKNTLTLVNELRPLWEGTRTMLNTISVLLYSYSLDADGQQDTMQIQPSNVTLDINVESLTEFFTQKIANGVTSFLTMLQNTVSNIQDGRHMKKKLKDYRIDAAQIKKAYIFLAGNASRSPIVRELFDVRIKHIALGLNIQLCSPMDAECGALNINYDRQPWVYPPTAKTGIAYGLLLAKKREMDMQIVCLNKNIFCFVLGMVNYTNNFFEPFSAQELQEGCCFAAVSPNVRNYTLHYTDDLRAQNIATPGAKVTAFTIHIPQDILKTYAGNLLYVQAVPKSCSCVNIYVRLDGSNYDIGSYDLRHIQI